MENQPYWATDGETGFKSFRKCVRHAEGVSPADNYGLVELDDGWAWWYPKKEPKGSAQPKEYKTPRNINLKLPKKKLNPKDEPYDLDGKPVTNKKKKKSKQHEFLHSKEWRAIRAIIIDYYGRQCMRCGSTENIQVDHIKPKSKYPELALDLMNLQVLCWPCNKAKNTQIVDYRETRYRLSSKEIRVC